VKIKHMKFVKSFEHWKNPEKHVFFTIPYFSRVTSVKFPRRSRGKITYTYDTEDRNISKISSADFGFQVHTFCPMMKKKFWNLLLNSGPDPCTNFVKNRFLFPIMQGTIPENLMWFPSFCVENELLLWKYHLEKCLMDLRP